MPLTSHLRPHASHLTLHTSHLRRQTPDLRRHFKPHAPNLRLTPHTSHFTPQTSHLRPHTSGHTSDFRPQTPELTPQTSDHRAILPASIKRANGGRKAMNSLPFPRSLRPLQGQLAVGRPWISDLPPSPPEVFEKPGRFLDLIPPPRLFERPTKDRKLFELPASPYLPRSL